MDHVAINTTLTLADWRALQAICQRRLPRGETALAQWVRIGAMALFVGLALAAADAGQLTLHPLSFAAGFIVVSAAIFVNARLAMRRMRPEENGAFLGACLYELGPEGVRSSRGNAHSFFPWDRFVDVTQTDQHFFLWIDRFQAYIIPTRDLPAGLPPQALADGIATSRAQAISLATAPTIQPARGAAETAQTSEPPAASRSGTATFIDLLRLLVLSGKSALTRPSHGLAATLTTLLTFATWAAIDRWETGPGAEFFVYGLPTLAWYFLGGLAVAWAFARLSVPTLNYSRAIVVVALGAWLAIVYSYLRIFIENRWLAALVSAAAVIYAVSYFIQAAHALTGRSQPRAVPAAIIAVVAFFWVDAQLYVYPSIWTYTGADEETYAERLAQVEPLLFAQRERLDAALNDVQTADANETEVFFVGFAGYGDEKVFAEEIKFAANVVGERYGSYARSVLLLNDSRDFDAAPLATSSTLRHALAGVSAKMDRDDDILFLALSSHGSRDWQLSVSNDTLPLSDLSSHDLAAALAESGIKWRIIVISACFAGGFIETLQDPQTIVLTAAAPDRTSFGCSNERDLTYFGEALYRDTLPMPIPLRDVFAQAEHLVLERETAAGIEKPSLPQASFGSELERKLAEIESFQP